LFSLYSPTNWDLISSIWKWNAWAATYNKMGHFMSAEHSSCCYHVGFCLDKYIGSDKKVIHMKIYLPKVSQNILWSFRHISEKFHVGMMNGNRR
jgi:hypothetical protein